MEPVLFAAGCFTAAVALAAGIYASFTARGKGPVLSNSYWFSVLKRENANKKAEYRLVTVVFSCLSAIFLLLAPLFTIEALLFDETIVAATAATAAALFAAARYTATATSPDGCSLKTILCYFSRMKEFFRPQKFTIS